MPASKRVKPTKTKVKAWLKAHGHDKARVDQTAEGASDATVLLLTLHGVTHAEYARAGRDGLMPHIAVPYCSFEDLRSYRAIGTTETTDDNLLRDFAVRASGVWERICRGRRFYPHVETRYYDHPQDDRVLRLDDDLLELTTFTTDNDAETVTAAQYYLMCGERYNVTPYDRIAMKSDGTRPNLLYSGTPQKANKIIGTWGYHNDWTNAWANSQDTVQNATSIAANGTSLTVTDADGADQLAVTPRFKVQQLLKIDSEYLFVAAKDTSTNALTVIRGVNGTTAAVHLHDATVYVYRPVEAIFHAVTRLAVWLYQQRSAPADQDRPVIVGDGTTLLPAALPKDITTLAQAYVRRSYR